MKTKKNLTLLLVVVMIIGMMLTACSKNEDSGAVEGGNRLEEIKERGYIEVATEPYFAPNEFIDPSKEGQEQYQGSDMVLAKYIADKIGVELKIVPLEFGAVQSGVASGKYDLALSALAYTPERAEAMEMSKGYYFSKEGAGHGLMIRKEDVDNIKSPEDLADKTVVVQSGSLQEIFINEQIPAYEELKRVSATPDGFLMVQEDKADTCVVSIRMAELYIEANPEADLMIVEGFKFELPEEYDGIRVGMPKGETNFADYINEIVDEVVESGQYNEWYEDAKDYASSLGL